MTLPPVSNQEPPRRAHLTYIPQRADDEFRRAAVQRDSAETSRVLEQLLGVDVNFQYEPEALEEKKEIYGQLKELLSAYKATVNPFFASAVHFAANTGSIEELRNIKDPALFNATDSKGMTPLHYAIASKKRDCIFYLVEKCDLNQLTPFGDSYLHFAALQGDRELLNLFIHKGLNAAAPNRLGLTPAHYWATSSDDLTGLKRLKRAGADLDAQAGDLPLTPIGIQILKTIEAHPDPVGDVDLTLLGVNALRSLLAATLLKLPEMSLWKNRASYYSLYTLYMISGLAQQKLVEEVVPADQAVLKKIVGVSGWLESKIMGRVTASTIPNTVNAAGTTVALASHAISSLSRYKYADWGTRLLATGVHALNLSASLVDCYLAFTHPFDFYKSLKAADRIQDTSLIECTNKDPSKMEVSEIRSCVESSLKMLEPKANIKELAITSLLDCTNKDRSTMDSSEIGRCDKISKLMPDPQGNREELKKLADEKFELKVKDYVDQIAKDVELKNHPELQTENGAFINAQKAASFLLGLSQPNAIPVATDLAKLSLQERMLQRNLRCLDYEEWNLDGAEIPRIREERLCPLKAHYLLASPNNNALPASLAEARENYRMIRQKLLHPSLPLTEEAQAEWLKTGQKNQKIALEVAKFALSILKQYYKV